MKNKHRGWQRVLLLIIPYIFIVGFFQFIGALVTNVELTTVDFSEDSLQELTSSFFDLLGTFLVLWIFMKFIDKEKFIKLGFETKNRLIEFLIGIGIGVIIMSIGYFLLLILGEIDFQRILFDYKETIISMLLFTIVAIVEEVLCRGYILRNLMNSFHKYVALIISSLMFSAMHGFNPNVDLFALTNIFLAGILLGLSYTYTKNLWFPIALHLSWNLAQTLFGFNVSGQDGYSIIEFSVKENNILNGGAFGFEGSIFSLISMVITIIVIWMYYNRERTKQNIRLKK